MNTPTQDTDVYKRPWNVNDSPQLKARGRHFARNLMIAMFCLWSITAVIILLGYFSLQWIGEIGLVIGAWSSFMNFPLELALVGIVLRFRLPWYWIPISLMPFVPFTWYIYTLFHL